MRERAPRSRAPRRTRRSWRRRRRSPGPARIPCSSAASRAWSSFQTSSRSGMLVLDRLAREVVPAPDEHRRRDAEAPRRLDHVRLRAAEEAARDDQHRVDVQPVDRPRRGPRSAGISCSRSRKARPSRRVHLCGQLEVGRPRGDPVGVRVADELQQASCRPPASASARRRARGRGTAPDRPRRAEPPPTRSAAAAAGRRSRRASGGSPAARPAASRTPGRLRSRAARGKAPGGASREGRWRRPAGAATGFPSANRIGRRRPRLDLEAFPAASAAGGADGRDTNSGQHGLLEAERMSAVTEQGPQADASGERSSRSSPSSRTSTARCRACARPGTTAS